MLLRTVNGISFQTMNLPSDRKLILMLITGTGPMQMSHSLPVPAITRGTLARLHELKGDYTDGFLLWFIMTLIALKPHTSLIISRQKVQSNRTHKNAHKSPLQVRFPSQPYTFIMHAAISHFFSKLV